MAFIKKRKSLVGNQEAESVVTTSQAQTENKAERQPDKQPRSKEEKLSIKPEANAGEKARLSCDISKRLHRKLRVAAAQDDTTIVAVVEKLIDTGINP